MREDSSTAAGIFSGPRFHPRTGVILRGRRAAAGLSGLGVGPGDAVGILLRNQVEWFEAWAAAVSLGAQPVPLNWHLREDELAHILADCSAKVLIGAADLLERFSGLAGPRSLVSVGGGGGGGAVGWESLLEGREPWPEEPGLAGGALLYTSGTTGLPKGIRRFPRSADRAAAYAETARVVYGIEPGMRTLIVAPLYHSAPYYHATAALQAGGVLVLMERFDAAETLELVERHRLTNLLLVPTIFSRLLQLPETVRERHSLASLRHVVHGAAPCPPELKRRMIDWLGEIIVEYYGCTESGIVTAVSSAEWLQRPGTVGRPVAGATVEIVDEDGRPVAPGTPGEIYVRNQGAAEFTYENLPAERTAVELRGLVTCADVGYLDDAGYLYLLDRRKDMVISGGVNVYPAEVEAQLTALPGVTDCAVFGIPDADYGEALAALVCIRPGGPDADAIRAHLESRLGRLKIPRLIEIRPRLPRDLSGKLLKRQLKEPYWSGRERGI